MTSPYIATPDYYSGAAGQAVAATYAADPFGAHVIPQIHAGYSATAASGSMTITSGGTVKYTIPIIAGGPVVLPFDPPFFGGVNEEVVITLKGVGVVLGFLNIWHFVK